MTARYAVYALPGALAPDPLRALAESWLGRDDVDAITVDARRYGFHATLKAPFHLADGVDVAELEERVARLADATAPTTIPRIGVYLLGGFFALMAGVPAPGLHALGDAVVRGLDDLRAPATAAERARRRPERLTARQRELLDAFGYPYVLDEFVAHLTLTDRVPEADRPRVAAALEEHFASELGRDVPVDALCVFVEPAPGAPFALHSVSPLRGTQPPAQPPAQTPALAAQTQGAS